ncbi:MFS transporter [Pseudoalteromonas espejiana]
MNSLKAAGNFTLLCIASLTIMVGTLLAPGLVSISNGLGITNNTVLLITLPSLGAVVFAPIAGRLIDKYGAYKLLIIGLFLYGFVGASGYFLYGPTLVFINRFILGGITAIVMAGCTVLISTWYKGEARLGMISKQGMAMKTWRSNIFIFRWLFSFTVLGFTTGALFNCLGIFSHAFVFCSKQT